jgi:hypothetical protein
MEPLIIEPTSHSPGIRFEPSSGKFLISGVSRPEDVRTFYYPVVDWLRKFLDEEIKTGKVSFDETNPLILDVTLKYFNSSSAKFLFDIFSELGNINEEGGKLKIRWFYEAGDDDMLEAGEELSEIAEIPFEFIET